MLCLLPHTLFSSFLYSWHLCYWLLLHPTHPFLSQEPDLQTPCFEGIMQYSLGEKAQFHKPSTSFISGLAKGYGAHTQEDAFPSAYFWNMKKHLVCLIHSCLSPHLQVRYSDQSPRPTSLPWLHASRGPRPQTQTGLDSHKRGSNFCNWVNCGVMVPVKVATCGVNVGLSVGH